MKSQKPNLLHYLDEYVVEEGLQRFMFPHRQTFVCTLAEPHLVETEVIFLSDKKEGAFIYCSKHHDFFDVSYHGECGLEGGDTTK